MVEQLTAFEFIAASEEPQLIRLRRGLDGEVLVQFCFIEWGGIDLRPLNLMFQEREELVIEGQGVGHPFWNGEMPTWLSSFDGYNEAKRIATIRAAVVREVNRAKILLALQ